MTEKWLTLAKELGFDEAAALDMATLKPMPMVRDMCAADKCRAYGKNWTCPPACGTLEDCGRRLASYRHGILLQSVGRFTRTIDTRVMNETEARHNLQLRRLAGQLHREFPHALCLGAGGCRICQVCAYPDECRCPGEAMAGMEAYGLFVTQICRDNGLPYYHGEKTVTFTGCILF